MYSSVLAPILPARVMAQGPAFFDRRVGVQRALAGVRGPHPEGVPHPSAMHCYTPYAIAYRSNGGFFSSLFGLGRSPAQQIIHVYRSSVQDSGLKDPRQGITFYSPRKSKPVERRGHKATSLFEVVGLPKGVEMQAVALHCLCGHSILCQVVREGERLGSLVFFDDEVTSSTYGERIEHCPKCGLRLAIHNLLQRGSHRGKPGGDLREEESRPGAS
jgi:hypothetical protein